MVQALAAVIEKLLAGQSAQVFESVMYLPASQPVAVHGLPENPALHWHSELPAGEFEFDGHARHTSLTAPVLVEYLPARQSVHAPAPVPVLYLPATQAVHVPLSGPV